MLIELFLNIVKVSFKKRWHILKFLVCSSMCLGMLGRYYIKLTLFTEKGNLTRCKNITYKVLDGVPDVSYFEGRSNLDWQVKNEVHMHVKSFGKARKDKAFLTIGIPSIKRVVNSTYLIKTLYDLEQKTSQAEKSNIICVIFLSDDDQDYNTRVEHQIESLFPDSMGSGFFQVIQVGPEFYPPLEGLKRNFKDAPERVRWRSKQVADFVFMFRYCSSLGQYHLQLEDDVTTVEGFVESVRSYIRAVEFREDLRDLRQISLKLHEQNPREASLSQALDLLLTRTKNVTENFKTEARWAILEFSQLGFIGKLFRSKDLEGLASFLAFYYDEQPVDWLIVYFFKSVGQSQRYSHAPALFQHFGLKSSFDHLQDNKLKDKAFSEEAHTDLLRWHRLSRIRDAINPPALITSDFSDEAELFYVPSRIFRFRGKDLKVNQTVKVLFAREQEVRNVTLETGDGMDHCLRDATLLVGRKQEARSVEDIQCLKTKEVARLDECSGTFILNETRVSCMVLRLNVNIAGEVTFVNFLIFPP